MRISDWSSDVCSSDLKTLRMAADLVRQRAEDIAACITREQGKPLAESRAEAVGAADHIDWYAEEGRRSYGRIIPARAATVSQWVVKEPVGPVAAFTPWNFPVGQLVRKIAGARSEEHTSELQSLMRISYAVFCLNT